MIKLAARAAKIGKSRPHQYNILPRPVGRLKVMLADLCIYVSILKRSRLSY
jgi:hypothetical protein